MDTNPLRITLDTLRSQRVVSELRAIELRDELETERQRLNHLHGAIENIEALLGEPSEDDAAVLSEDGVRIPATPREVDFTNTLDQQGLIGMVNQNYEAPVRKRVPSTEWVAEAVDALGRPSDRDAIYEKFEEMRGIPASWVSNPRNSFNNALGRAVERQLIIKLSDNEFAPKDFNPFEDDPHTSDRGRDA